MKSAVIVAFGGRSTEHDVSIVTGVLAFNALKGVGENVIPLYINKKGEWLTGNWMKDVTAFSRTEGLKTERLALLHGSDTLYTVKKGKLKPIGALRAALVCLHGKNGEDGAFAAQMKAHNIPVSSPGMTESALLMDKWLTKQALCYLDIPSLPCVSVLRGDFIRNPQNACKAVSEKISFPVCVKPARLGSSIGISVCKSEEELAEGLIAAFRYDFRAIVEPALTDFEEYSVGVYAQGERVICGNPTRQTHKGSIFSFQEKYCEGGGYLGGNTTTCHFPENLTVLAEKAYRLLALSGVVRVDFLAQGEDVYLNEINTVPGSLAYYYFAENTKDAGAFFKVLLQEGIRRFREENALSVEYPSSVLSGIAAGGKKEKGERMRK